MDPFNKIATVNPKWIGEPELGDDGHAWHASVGSFEPNGFGIFDMHGNVWELCRGIFVQNPRRFAFRGGSYWTEAWKGTSPQSNS